MRRGDDTPLGNGNLATKWGTFLGYSRSIKRKNSIDYFEIPVLKFNPEFDSYKLSKFKITNTL